MTDLVRIWIVPVNLPPDVAASCLEVLDESERARAAVLRSPRDQRQFTIAHGALRILAGHALGAPPATLAWVTGPHGKPELTPPWSGLHTSLSHSADMIAAATSTSRQVGVDIQHLVPGLDTVGLSARFFPPQEARYVASGADTGARADRFAQLWARKEAVVKAVGGRLWPNLGIAVRNLEVVSCAEPVQQVRVADITAPAGFRAAVALTGAAPFAIEAATWPGEVTAAGAAS